MENKAIELDISSFANELGVEISDLCRLFTEYCHEMRDELAHARKLSEVSDWQKLQRVVHNIKGVSANLGLSDMFKAAEKIDLEIKGNRLDTIVCDIEQLEATYAATENSIKAAFRAYDMNIF